MFTEILSGLLQVSRVHTSIKQLLIRPKLSVEIMECQAMNCARVRVGVLSGTLELIVWPSGCSLDHI